MLASLFGASCVLPTDPAQEDLSLVEQPLSAADPAQRAELALHWAPIHYMDVDQTGDHALGGRSDYLTRVDFDGNLNANDNWENLASASASLAAHAYFSLVETSSHWFLVYMFFHPRDWADSAFQNEHENDSEGLLLAVERDGSPYGALRAAVTVAHSDFYSFLPAQSTWTGGREDIDGTLQMVSFAGSLHPVTAQEAKGHGLKARPYYDIRGGDGIVYYPSLSQAETPDGPNDRDVKYKLVDLALPGGLWARRDERSLFASFGSFGGDHGGGCGAGTRTCSDNAAHAPWAWDDGNDLPGRGELATDPAKLVSEYFRIPEALSRSYLYNPYR